MTKILEGRPVAAALRSKITDDVAAFSETHGRAPGLAAVEVAGDLAAEWYIRSIRRACDGVGMTFRHTQLDRAATQRQLEDVIENLNADANVDGVILHMPLPPHLDGLQAVLALDPGKDVDGLHPLNLGRLAQGLPTLVPNTPAGGMELLRHYQVPIAGRKAVVVGRSNVVGKPMALLLLNEHATVTVCHSRTPDLAEQVREGEIVVVAVGRAGLVTGSMIRPGAVVVDFGINVDADGVVHGDVSFEDAAAVAGAITPVPGGTGPVTNMMLLRNTLIAGHRLLGSESV